MSNPEATDAKAFRELSGTQWCSRYPTRTDIESLEQGFKANLISFLGALRSAGADVVITATLRPIERAYLMHYAWNISRKLIGADAVPAQPGVSINWVHDSSQGSIDAADAMVKEYAMVAEASLTSNHLTGRAVDMILSWTDTLAIKDATGNLTAITSQPRDGTNPNLALIGANYKVFHELSFDPPHWSYNGH